ncbi:MAG: cation transporter [Phenylobacterium sp.]|uniref:cation transporter n=1 Tax=Phenylobacterium sp. TaxID=1871053 RepID=UPI000DAF568F|nr:cation transporter [Phenylobacterium sp.]MBJ7409494.1 cation transporter [Phenylobacterium sp.]PZQ55673.1 MAG: cation transporter [Phenylobacterium zucineum]
MGASCCAPPPPKADPRWRRALWIALIVNAGMFLVEFTAGFAGRSVSLWADAADFLGDSANYAISLAVVGLALQWRARASLLKGATMALFGLGVLGMAVWNASRGGLPHAETMGVVGFLALLANVGVAIMLFRHRSGDSNMRSVWLCSRNDAIGNVAVMAAAAGVFGTGSAWPDLAVAGVMASLALWSAVQVIRQALGELRGTDGTLDAHAHHA